MKQVLCRHPEQVKTMFLNRDEGHGYPESLFVLDAPAVRMRVHGHVECAELWRRAVHGYALARLIIEHVLGGHSGHELRLEMYLSVETARERTATKLAYLHFPSMTIHLHPWNTLGHEIAHFVSYHALGGRPGGGMLEEAVATYFSRPDVRLHGLAMDLAGSDGGRARLRDRICRGQTLDKQDRLIDASFAGYLLEMHELEKFRAMWRQPGAWGQVVAQIYGRDIEDLCEEWMAMLAGRRLAKQRDLQPLLGCGAAAENYQTCAQCRCGICLVRKFKLKDDKAEEHVAHAGAPRATGGM
ncbi:MAG: hypothetical protein IT443_10520 [Phycisphaeraceae bacterium]|nr:hypothetical protein [Phycisphaeraceae bacterium]